MKSDSNYDFSQIGNQGAYISTFTPQRLSEYLNEIIIPEESAYHVVGCYYPNYLSKMNSWHIVEKYLTVSEVQRRTIIDLCLPYHDDNSKKTYLGRYIIFSGYLVGIRLNTNNTLLAPYYSAWPKHKTKSAIFSSRNQQNNEIMIGEISLHLINARIGLLFEAELKTSANEYINCGYDIIVLSYETIAPESKVITKKNEISKKAFLVESKMGYFDECVTKRQIEGLGCETIELPKNTIYVDYYQLSRIFSSKKYLRLSQKVEFDIRSISIRMAFTQPRERRYTLSSQKMASVYNISSHIQKPVQQPLNRLSADANSDVFLKRLLKIFFLCNRCRVILMLEESPTTICFLYVIRSLLDVIKTKHSSLNISELFTTITLQNARFNLIAEKFGIFKFGQLNEDSSETANDNFDSRLIKTLEDIMNQQKHQQFFAIITSNPRIQNIVRLLNEKQNILLVEHYQNNIEGSESGSLSVECVNKREIKLQSWLVCEFFSLEELKSVYFSSEMKSMVDDSKYHGQLWLKQVNLAQASRQNKCQKVEDIIDLNLESLQVMASIHKMNLSHLFREDNLVIYQFNELITRLQERGFFGTKNEVFPHFLFRKVTVMSSFHCPSYIVKSSMNILEEFIITDKQYVYPLFQLITHHYCSLSERIQHRLTLRKIAHIRQQHVKYIQCHRCAFKYPSSLIFRCKDINCEQSFCYQCLVDVKLIESHLLKEGNKNATTGEGKLSNCPACLGFCESSCKKCSIKSISAKLRKGQTVKSGRSQCHFCYQASALHYYVCSDGDCKRMFCKRCIEEYYKDKKKEYHQLNWRCYVCRQVCFCNNCQIDRARFMKIVETMGVQQEVQRQLNKQAKVVESKAKEERINFDSKDKSIRSLQDRSSNFKDNVISKQSLSIKDNFEQIDNTEMRSIKRQYANPVQKDDFDANLTPLWKIDVQTGEAETVAGSQKKKNKKKGKSEPLAFKQAGSSNIKIEAKEQQQKKPTKTKVERVAKQKQAVEEQEQDTHLAPVPPTQNKLQFNFPQFFANQQFDY